MKRPAAPAMAVGVLMVLYVAVFGTLSLRRHQNLRTNALDLGYTDQAVWNTLQGRPFRFSTYLDPAFRLDIPIQDFREPDMLLGYHVEPILAAIAPLYLIHDGPETLLWLQTIGIALGAIPLYLLACHRLMQQAPEDGSRASPGGSQRVPEYASRILRIVAGWLPVAFVFVYFLAPALEAANLSDFHGVALAPAFLLAAFYFLETDRPWGFVLFAFLATMTKEEVGLLVAMMGLWAAFVRGRRWLGLGVFVAAAGWSLFCVGFITPYYNGLVASAFLVRYGQFGDSPVGIVRNLVLQPNLAVDWLRRPDVVRYLRDLMLSSGGLAMLYPLTLAMAAPLLAINAMSAYAWMRSGGGHYSAAIVPFLLISAVYGVAWVAKVVGRWASEKLGAEQARLYWGTASFLVVCGLFVVLLNHHQHGISPLSRRFALDPVSEHARRAQPFVEFVNQLPPEVRISASSGLYPHVAHRQWAYLFPTVSDAQFILIDVTGPGSPSSVGDQRLIVRDLLDYAKFGVAGSDHGLLLLERDLDQYLLSPGFYDAFHAEDPSPERPMVADFGGVIRLEGFDWDVRPVVRPGLVVEITTYWQALTPLDDGYRLVFFFWDEEGQLVRVQPEERIVHWYPTWLWDPGQVVKVTLPPLPVGDLAHAGVAVLHPGADDADIEGRVVPITSPGGQPLSLLEQDTILELMIP